MPNTMRMKITEDFTPGDLDVTGFTDENGQPLAFQDAASEGSKLPSKLFVVVESTHTGVNRNKVEYTMNGLENSVASWTDNYNKPVLLNHNPYSDNIGRVKKAEYTQSVIDSSKYCIKLTLEITNQAAIERFLDGRYKTFSIGGYTDSAKCSICGKDQMTDGWCGHQRGKKYDGKECYWTLGNMDYDEISVVNCPADPHAQAIDIKVITNEPQQNDSHDGDEPGNVEDMFTSIDTTLGHSDENEPGEDGTSNDGNNGSQADNNENVNSDTNEPESEPAQTDGLAELQAKLEIAEARVAELELQSQEDEQTIATLTADVESATTDKAELQGKLDAIADEKKALVKQNVEYAKFAHKVLCEKVADMQILVGEKQADEREALLSEYAAKTTRALNDMAIAISTKPRALDNTRPQVTSPAQVTDGDTDETPNSGVKQKNLASFEDAFSAFFRSKL